MPEKHTVGFDYFDLDIDVTDEGSVVIALRFPEAVPSIGMDYEDFREVIDCVGRFGLGMKAPMLVEYDDTVEGAAERAAESREAVTS